MGFLEADAYLKDLGVDVMKDMAPSLRRMRAICEALDHPERAIPAIHITGTNGKTSVAKIASSLLDAMGLSVGTYTSPHLSSVTERIELSGIPLPEEEFGGVFDRLLPYLRAVEDDLGERLTYFEVLTALFFLWAVEKPVDALVVEVGLGGLWDATNVMDGAVAVITGVDLDHTALLGGTPVRIATEKAGVIKPGSVVVTAERNPEVLGVIRGASEEAGASLVTIGRDFEVTSDVVAVGGRYLTLLRGGREIEFFLPLHGSHQAINAAVALEAVARFLPAHDISADVLEAGFGGVRVPGRLHRLGPSVGSPTVVLDVAHNPAGMSAMISGSIESFVFEKAVVVVAVLDDKDHEGMLREIARLAPYVICTETSSIRSLKAADLADAAGRLGLQSEAVPEIPDAIARSLEIASANDLVCVTGSHYLVGEARELFIPDHKEDLAR